MKGARRHGLGWQASVFVKGVGRSFQPFPLQSTQAEIDEWRRGERARLELQREALDRGAPAGTFAADAKRYLASVKAMKDFKNRAYDISLWVDVFGSRRRATIKAHEIRAQRDRWLTVGPKRVYDRRRQAWTLVPEPLAASTVNHRLRALENLFTVLSPQGYNPVRDVPEADEPDEQDRSIPYDVIEMILAAMPDRGRGLKGQPRSTISKSKARLRLMAHTGLTPGQIMALTPADIDAELPAVRVPRRHKGRGAPGGWRPFSADAVPALRAFIAADAWGSFSRDAMRQSWQRACHRLGLPRIRPYDLRHSFVATTLDDTGDLKAAQHLAGHADSRTTERYAQRAIPGWLRAAAAKVRTLRHQTAPALRKASK
jgi:integrase